MIDRPFTDTAPARAYGPRLRNRARSSRGLDILAFAIPALLSLEFTLIGRLFGAEMLIFAIAPIILLFKGRLLMAPMPRTLLMFGLIWLLSQVATDLIRNTPFEDYSRGWSKITFMMVNFSVLYMLLHNSRRRLIIFAIGVAVGGYFHHVINPSVFADLFPWKFGVAIPVTFMLVVAAQRGFERNAPRVVSMLLFFAAGLNLYLGFRSLGGISFVTAMFIFIQARQSQPGARISQARMAIISVVGIVGVFGFFEFYSYAASEGLLGSKAQEKYQFQASKELGLLAGGRTEALVALYAIADSPFIGHGSWAKDRKYRNMLFKLGGASVKQQLMGRGLGLIPSHSFILGAWVEAGFLGALFWAYVLWLIVRNLFYLSQAQEVLTPIIAFVSFLMLWDVILSPFGADRRVLVPFYIVLVMFSWDAINADKRAARAVARQRRRL